MVAVLDESVPQRILGDGRLGLGLFVFPQQEVDHLLHQRLRRHLPYDPVEQGRGGQDAHLGPVPENTRRQRALTTRGSRTKGASEDCEDDWRVSQPYVCISCGSMTDTKNLSLTVFAMTAAAD